MRILGDQQPCSWRTRRTGLYFRVWMWCCVSQTVCWRWLCRAQFDLCVSTVSVFKGSSFSSVPHKVKVITCFCQQKTNIHRGLTTERLQKNEGCNSPLQRKQRVQASAEGLQLQLLHLSLVDLHNSDKICHFNYLDEYCECDITVDIRRSSDFSIIILILIK